MTTHILGAQWMVRQWLTQFGEEETIRLMECNNRRPTFSLRFRPPPWVLCDGGPLAIELFRTDLHCWIVQLISSSISTHLFVFLCSQGKQCSRGFKNRSCQRTRQAWGLCRHHSSLIAVEYVIILKCFSHQEPEFRPHLLSLVVTHALDTQVLDTYDAYTFVF